MTTRRRVVVDADRVRLMRDDGVEAEVAWVDVAEVRVQTASEGPSGEALWLILIDAGGGRCVVPSEMPGYGGLLQDLVRLPAFDKETFLLACGSHHDAEFLCWRKQDPTAVRRRRARMLWVPLAAAGLAALCAWWLLRSGSEGESGAGGSRTSGGPEMHPTLEARGTGAFGEPAASPKGVRVSRSDPALAGVGGLRLRVVRASDGVPVAGAAVLLHGTGHGAEWVRLAARSASDGVASVPRVPAGEWYTLRVHVPGEVAVIRADVDVLHDAVTDLGDVRLGARPTVLVPVWDEGGRPLARARVDLRDPSDTPSDAYSHDDPVRRALAAGRTVASFTAGEDGVAVLGDMAPGVWTLEVSSPGRVAVRRTIAVTQAVGFTVDPIVLPKATLLRGRVVDPRGNPVGHARVVVGEPTGSRLGGVTRAVPVLAGATGDFEAAVPETGAGWGLWASADGRPLAYQLVLPPADHVRVVLGDGVPLELMARDAATDAPIPGALVEVNVSTIRAGEADAPQGGDWWSWSGRTDQDGWVRTVVPAGRLESLTVAEDDHERAAAALGGRAGEPGNRIEVPGTVLEAGRALSLVAVLPPWARTRIEGRVVDGGGRPVAGAVVLELGPGASRDAGGIPVARSDESGAFRAEVPTWRHRNGALVARLAGWTSQRRRGPDGATIESDTGIVLVLEPSSTHRGRVVDAEGLPVAGAAIHRPQDAGRDGGRPLGHSGPDGAFVVSDLSPEDVPPGDALVVKALGFLEGRGEPTETPPGRTVDVGVVVLVRGGSVSGVVRDPEGLGVAGATVDLGYDNRAGRRRLGPDRSATTDASGAFRFLGVPHPDDRVLTVRTADPLLLPARTRVDLTAEDLHVAVEIVLPRATRCSGVAVDPAGRPVALARVRCLRGAAEGSRRLAVLATAMTDESGRFVLGGLPLGDATLLVEARGGWMGWIHVTLAASDEAAAPLRIVVVPPGPATKDAPQPDED